jgi:hypothetical protein
MILEHDPCHAERSAIVQKDNRAQSKHPYPTTVINPKLILASDLTSVTSLVIPTDQILSFRPTKALSFRPKGGICFYWPSKPDRYLRHCGRAALQRRVKGKKTEPGSSPAAKRRKKTRHLPLTARHRDKPEQEFSPRIAGAFGSRVQQPPPGRAGLQSCQSGMLLFRAESSTVGRTIWLTDLQPQIPPEISRFLIPQPSGTQTVLYTPTRHFCP